MARKIGAPVYALPEDISEVRAAVYTVNLTFVSGEAQDGDDRVRQPDAGRHEVGRRGQDIQLPCDNDLQWH